jgi:hypothetical protein
MPPHFFTQNGKNYRLFVLIVIRRESQPCRGDGKIFTSIYQLHSDLSILDLCETIIRDSSRSRDSNS